VSFPPPPPLPLDDRMAIFESCLGPSLAKQLAPTQARAMCMRTDAANPEYLKVCTPREHPAKSSNSDIPFQSRHGFRQGATLHFMTRPQTRTRIRTLEHTHENLNAKNLQAASCFLCEMSSHIPIGDAALCIDGRLDDVYGACVLPLLEELHTKEVVKGLSAVLLQSAVRCVCVCVLVCACVRACISLFVCLSAMPWCRTGMCVRVSICQPSPFFDLPCFRTSQHQNTEEPGHKSCPILHLKTHFPHPRSVSQRQKSTYSSHLATANPFLPANPLPYSPVCGHFCQRAVHGCPPTGSCFGPHLWQVL
jgi:hypothetical protein